MVNDLIETINETIYSLPTIIQEDIIENKQPLVIFDKFVASLNNSNITNVIKKVISSYKNITQINITDSISNYFELFNNASSEIKSNIEALNNIPLTEFVQNLENITVGYLQKYSGKFNISQILAYFKNFRNIISERKNDFEIIFNKTKEQVASIFNAVNKANTTEITHLFEDQIKLVSGIIQDVISLIKSDQLNITERIKDYINNNKELNEL